jgi:hypothetical protein
VSAAPNALTECQRVRCERPREGKGGTADAYKESRLRRASEPPSSSEHRGEQHACERQHRKCWPDRSETGRRSVGSMAAESISRAHLERRRVLGLHLAPIINSGEAMLAKLKSFLEIFRDEKSSRKLC